MAKRLGILDAYLSADKQPKVSPRRAHRLRCLDCCGNQQSEVAECTGYFCPAWSYRMGGTWEPVPKSAWEEEAKQRIAYKQMGRKR